MKYNEKLHVFFKSKDLSQKNVAETLGFSPAMISRYLSGVSVFPPEFLTSLIKHFPDIDLRYVFMEDAVEEMVTINEPDAPYNPNDKEVVNELQLIEDKIARIKNVLARKCHE
jgi:transcriptional regulator with XRE-family HTH domain